MSEKNFLSACAQILKTSYFEVIQGRFNTFTQLDPMNPYIQWYLNFDPNREILYRIPLNIFFQENHDVLMRMLLPEDVNGSSKRDDCIYALALSMDIFYTQWCEEKRLNPYRAIEIFVQKEVLTCEMPIGIIMARLYVLLNLGEIKQNSKFYNRYIFIEIAFGECLRRMFLYDPINTMSHIDILRFMFPSNFGLVEFLRSAGFSIINNKDNTIHNQLNEICREKSFFDLLCHHKNNFVQNPDILKSIILKKFSEIDPINIKQVFGNNDTLLRQFVIEANRILENNSTCGHAGFEQFGNLFWEIGFPYKQRCKDVTFYIEKMPNLDFYTLLCITHEFNLKIRHYPSLVMPTIKIPGRYRGKYMRMRIDQCSFYKILLTKEESDIIRQYEFVQSLSKSNGTSLIDTYPGMTLENMIELQNLML